MRPRVDALSAVVASGVDLRLRMVQAQALATMMSLCPDRSLQLLPLLHEALNAPPAVDRDCSPPPPAAVDVTDTSQVPPPPAEWHMPNRPVSTIRVLDRRRYTDDVLSAAQVATVQALANGCSPADIAIRYHQSRSAVKSRLKVIGRRLGLQHNAQAHIVAECFRRGLID